MSQVKKHVALAVIYAFSLTAPFSDASAKPKKKINPNDAVEKLFSDRAKKVNELNREQKEASGLSAEEERELHSKVVPLTLTPEEIKREDAETAKDPDEQVEDGEDEENAGVALDEEDDASKGASSGGKALGSSGSSGASGKTTPPLTKPTPPQVPSSSGSGTAVPGQADPNMIVYPGKKKP